MRREVVILFYYRDIYKPSQICMHIFFLDNHTIQTILTYAKRIDSVQLKLPMKAIK